MPIVALGVLVAAFICYGITILKWCLYAVLWLLSKISVSD